MRKIPMAPRCCIRPLQPGNLDMIRALADAHVNFDEPNKDGLTALDVAEGKQPAGAACPRWSSRRVARPPAGGARGRGGRGGGTTPQDVAKLLRELMGLPPAPPAHRAARSEPSCARRRRSAMKKALLAAAR